ncbi:phosphoribosylglycinamide formyltransferase [Pikeienuella piscinae]|uniref:Phosphoribosylglycinamide formyltransferase n=1 Tax=Pikeienuella piscinae TaxID=2748098 RepID=A0A7L5BWN0_9RHOB|nr:phosphoribosylglycinamide formyltransferase [Pikeienuella piscinae]QIE54656.1 phosphoribosylglycinamide formyltransferase [Pikeienuella piscinae]
MNSRRRAAIFISGRGSNMTALLRAMADPTYPAKAALVLSNNPTAPGLGLAAAAGVATAVVDHRPHKGDRGAFEAELSRALAAADIDLICLAGFMRILTGGFVDQWRDRMVNIHPSLLPAFTGLETHARALAAGVAFHGCTTHLVRAEMDDGPILGQAALRIRPEDDAKKLAARVLELEHRLYPASLLRWLNDDITLDNNRLRISPLAFFED